MQERTEYGLLEWTYGWPGLEGKEMGEGIVREFGMYVYTLLYFKE